MIQRQNLRVTRPTHLRKIMKNNKCSVNYSNPYGKLHIRLTGEDDIFFAINRDHDPKFSKYLTIAKENADQFTETLKNI